MPKVQRIGGKARIEADTVLTPADFARIAEELGETPVRARKVGYVAAREATTSEMVETRSDGKETTNTARPGDFIVTNLSPQRQRMVGAERHSNIYVIAAFSTSRHRERAKTAPSTAPREWCRRWRSR